MEKISVVPIAFNFATQAATIRQCRLCCVRSGTCLLFRFARHGAKHGVSGFIAVHRFRHQLDR